MSEPTEADSPRTRADKQIADLLRAAHGHHRAAEIVRLLGPDLHRIWAQGGIDALKRHRNNVYYTQRRAKGGPRLEQNTVFNETRQLARASIRGLLHEFFPEKTCDARKESDHATADA